MINNNKKVKLTIASFLTVGIIVNIFALYTFASETDNTNESGVTVYSFGYDVFSEFIENPVQEILEQQGNCWVIYVLTNMDSSDGRIKCEIINEDPVRVYKADSGKVYIGNLPVYSSLISFTQNKESLKKILDENGVVGEIENVAILDIRNMAVTIWLKVDQEDYFITVDERGDDYCERNDESKYVYRLYSYMEYYNKFGIKDGKLFVNGENITKDNYVKVNYSGAYIPFRVVMESLGAKVDWDAEKNVVLLSCNDEEYVFDPDSLYMTERGKQDNILLLPPGGYYYCKIIDDRTIMNSDAMEVCVGLMGAKISVDYKNLTVEINQ